MEHTLSTAIDSVSNSGLAAAGSGGDAEARARQVAAALRAVKEYADVVGYAEGEELETIIVDLLADVRHLCVATEVPFYIADARAADHFREEMAA